MDVVDIAVLGAGPAGLGAAFRAAGRGHDTLVLERRDHVGGLSASFGIAGIRVDHGSHRLHPSTDASILAVLRDLLGDDLQTRERDGRIRLQGRWVAFPLRPADVARHLPPRFAARALRDAVTTPLRRPRADTFAEVVRAGPGPAMLADFYGPYARKLWGLAPEELSGAQARARISATTPAALVRRVLRGADPAARTFHYPRRGFGQLWEALAHAALERGASIRLGTTVERLTDARGDGVDIATTEGAVRARHVLSTVPLPLLARLWGDTPVEVTAAARRLRSRAMVLVYLVLGVGRWTRFDAHYLPEGWTPVTRISEPRNYRDDPGEPDDRTVLCAEIPCQVGDDTWTASEDELAAVVRAAVRGAGLADHAPRDVVVRRVPAVYPVLDLDAPQAAATVEDWAQGLPRVTTFGRQGLHVHDNSHHALAMAWAAVGALRPDGSRDDDAWRAARERFRAHVVED